MRLVSIIFLGLLSFASYAAPYEFLASKGDESVIYFIDISRQAGTKNLIWVKTIFSPPKSLAVERPKRAILLNHIQTTSGWEIDCERRIGHLVAYVAYGTNGEILHGYSRKSFAVDFLGVDASPSSIVNMSEREQLDGDLTSRIIDRSCS